MTTGETKPDSDDPELAGLDIDERSTLARVEQRMFGAATVVHIDRYEVQEPLGGGGMGVVFAAWDPELRRRVAIKLVQIERGAGKGVSSGAATRLLREAQAIARISHPHVVPVHDVGTYGEGGDAPDLPGAAGHGVFVVMELVAGVDLGRWLDERRRPWSEVLDAFVAAGQGLAAAHASGILHRDFKPSNVLVGADGRVRVLDFGLARSIDGVEDVERETDATSGDALLAESMTKTGTVLGTPYFMAPEQLALGKADERGDQYAFCVALYYGLCGRGPFPRLGLRELAEAKNAGLVLPFPDEGGVPRWLERAVMRGLEPDPARRFPSMRALLDTLERGRHRRRTVIRTALLGGTVGLAVAIGLAVGRLGDANDRGSVVAAPGADPAVAADEPRIAFVRFEIGTGGDELAWAADGLPNLMAEELRGHPGLDVVSYYRLERRLAEQPRERWSATAAEQGATVIVTGTVTQSDATLELRVVATRPDGTVVIERAASTDPALLVEHARALAREVGGGVLGRRLASASQDARPIGYDKGLQLGIAALERFDFATAQLHLDAARRAAPESAEVHFYGAIVDEWMGRHAEAEAELDLAARGPLPESKRLFVAAFRTGVQRRHAEAVTAYLAALERYPDDIYLAYGLFEALYHGGHGDDAIAAFRRLRELSPGFSAGVVHVFDRAAASRDAETLAWAIEVAATAGAVDTAEVWRARERIMLADYRGALAIAEPLAERGAVEGELALSAHVLAGDVELARARTDQLIARSGGLELALLAICTAMGDEPGSRIAFDRERARIARTPVNDHMTMAWIALLVHELPRADPERIGMVEDGIEASVSQRFGGDLRVSMARALIGGARGDAEALAVARASPYEEVQEVALAFAAGEDHRGAAAHWHRAAGLALDQRFVLLERWHEARELRSLGDHDGVVAACGEIVRPASFDWSWGSTVGPCLAWTVEAEVARGDQAAAGRARDRLLALRSRAGAGDPLRSAVAAAGG